MRFLYIGQVNPGSTSGMRAKILQKILQPVKFSIIDTFPTIQETFSWFRSFGFRTNTGPLISNINNSILNQIETGYDLIWVDKANFITPETTWILRNHAKILVHFTPDTAFYSNRSHLFNKSMEQYDWLISSKTFEKDRYPSEKLILITQGFDKLLHQSVNSFDQKTRDVIFIGLYEPYRGKVIDVLLNSGISVTVGGIGWRRYRNINNPNVEYLGDKLFGPDYVNAISSSRFSLGLLSKKFPELHTTRTFEIPACGTALITERNVETSSFFSEDEVIFYDQIDEIPSKINYYLAHPDDLQTLTDLGHRKVMEGGFDYETILRKVLNKIGILNVNL